MNYLTVEKLSKTYGEKLLFEDITFGLEKGQKTAIIAKNGTGKSTLLNIIAGIEQPDTGQVVLRNDITISYLPQMDNFAEDISVIDTIFDTQTPVIQSIKEYETCLILLEKEAQSVELHERMNRAVEDMDRLQAWDFESKIKEILSRFGISDVFRPIGSLSGGQRKKAALAKTLIADTDLLILDEPTNHLDIEMIEWMEDYLTRANVTLLMVTHDRHFLDQICNDILEIENGNIYRYKGKYDYYLEKKTERITNATVEHEKIKSLYLKELEWVHTSPQARTSKAKSRIQSFEQLKDDVNRKVEKQNESFHVQPERLGNKILEINNLDFSYPNHVLLKDFSYIFKKGEKCGIVGKNGTGKSTFLNLIMGTLRPDAGKITAGQTIQFGYFSQDGLQVQGNKRIIDIVKEQAEVIRTESGNYIGASQFLNHFGFKYEQQYTYFEDLSGGEKRKLHLLITLMRNPNFLILDEPTNDFDIDTLNKLEDLLYHYKGCLLIVSHDRWFMNKIVDHLFVFDGDGKIKDFYGNYTDYKLAKDKALRLSRRQEKEAKPVEGKPKTQRVSNRLTYSEKKEFEGLEPAIEVLEKEKASLLQKMNSGAGSSDDLMQWSVRYQEVENDLDEKTLRWIELSEKDFN
ncbi:MAG TPA: ABC-F family ATP-binding cassette domain-containing protein [Bacteroidales bacterium]|nr:ABC-F family ATP-binding cassette domain-containing protein [Bacteroidales bacterium]HPT51867.1 ABC-F family ATP-binding cassette domain-containing protein [Bacteroidales bacterium]